MTILACSGFDEGPGANFTPPTLGEFMKKREAEIRVLREARAGAIVTREGRVFHERQARKYGINTSRGLAHFKASRMYTREGSKLQEMFDGNSQEHGQLPPKVVAKAAKAAMLFHKKQAEKAGLDSDLGHAHVAAMEHHADLIKKAKAQGQQPQQEALPGYKGKATPVPVPRKADMPSQDQKDPNKPPVKLNPADANKQPRRLQQTAGAHAGLIRASAEGGPGSGPRPKGIEKKSYGYRQAIKHAKSTLNNLNSKRDKFLNNHPAVKMAQQQHSNAIHAVRSALKDYRKNHKESRHRAINNLGRESGRGPHDNESCTLPKGVGRQVEPYLVTRQPRTKEAGEGGPGSGRKPHATGMIVNHPTHGGKATLLKSHEPGKVLVRTENGKVVQLEKQHFRPSHEADQFVSPKDQGGKKEGYTDPMYADLQHGSEANEGGPGSGRHKDAEHHYAKAKEYEEKRDSAYSQAAQDRYHQKAQDHYAKAYRLEHYGKSDESRRPVLESRRNEDEFDDGTPRPIDLKSAYNKPERTKGWKNSNVYSPYVPSFEKDSRVIIREY